MYLIDNDEFDKSDFYFGVIFNEEKKNYTINRCPVSDSSLQAVSSDGFALTDIERTLDAWLNILQSYRVIKTIYDNPARYQTQYFYEEFKIMDEDADIAPFNPNQVLLLDEYIEKYKANLDNLKQEHNKEAIDEIIKECEDVQNEIYSEPKNKVMKSIAKIWGKTVTTLKKEGRGFIKDAWEDFKKDIIGKLTKYITEGSAVAAVIEGVKQVF